MKKIVLIAGDFSEGYFWPLRGIKNNLTLLFINTPASPQG